MPVVDCSAGIMAYNEEANIGSAIEAILAQTIVCGRIAELIVVASGCTDRTVEIVQAIAEREPRVVLIIQDKRQGKASAINLFVRAATSPVLLMVSADVLVQERTLDSMLRHFQDATVGMVGGHPVPVNDESRFLGYTVHLLWRLHDRLARLSPKLGEIVAFRNVVSGIPADSAHASYLSSVSPARTTSPLTSLRGRSMRTPFTNVPFVEPRSLTHTPSRRGSIRA